MAELPGEGDAGKMHLHQRLLGNWDISGLAK